MKQYGHMENQAVQKEVPTIPSRSPFSKHLPFILVALVAALLASTGTYLALKQSNTPPQNISQIPSPSPTPMPDPTETTPTVNIAAGQTISSPLMIKGAVLNNWLFEGVFPIQLLDDNRKEIARTLAKQVSGSWTEPGIVTFEAKLEFVTAASSGYIVLMKDNPSGLPDKNVHFDIPVFFSQSSDKTSNWKTYTDKAFNFSFRYPSNWKIDNMPDDTLGNYINFFEEGVTQIPTTNMHTRGNEVFRTMVYGDEAIFNNLKNVKPISPTPITVSDKPALRSENQIDILVSNKVLTLEMTSNESKKYIDQILSAFQFSP